MRASRRSQYGIVVVPAREWTPPAAERRELPSRSRRRRILLLTLLPDYMRTSCDA